MMLMMIKAILLNLLWCQLIGHVHVDGFPTQPIEYHPMLEQRQSLMQSAIDFVTPHMVTSVLTRSIGVMSAISSGLLLQALFALLAEGLISANRYQRLVHSPKRKLSDRSSILEVTSSTTTAAPISNLIEPSSGSGLFDLDLTAMSDACRTRALCELTANSLSVNSILQPPRRRPFWASVLNFPPSSQAVRQSKDCKQAEVACPVSPLKRLSWAVDNFYKSLLTANKQ